MIFYVKFDPINQKIIDYSSNFDEEKHTFYLKIDLKREYNTELAYIHHNHRSSPYYRAASHSISVKKIQRLLIEKIRDDKLDYLLNI